MYKPKVLLLFAGGTIAMTKDPATGALVPAKRPEDFFALAPELNAKFKIDYEYIANIDSTNIQPSHWEKICVAIKKKYDDYDGFVITHGTDMMCFSASALSFALGPIGKPVVMTGSQFPIDDRTSDAKNNLVNAFRVATMDIGEVVVAFGVKILRGNRSTKRSEKELDAFISPKYPVIGNIWNDIELIGFHKKRSAQKPNTKTRFDEHVVIFTIHPGVEPKYFDALVASGVHGIVLTAVGSGNVPTSDGKSFEASIRRATDAGVPVVIESQCIEGAVKMQLYETGMAALNAGGISGGDMTLEAAATKLMWALGQTRDMKELRSLMERSIAGERTE